MDALDGPLPFPSREVVPDRALRWQALRLPLLREAGIIGCDADSWLGVRAPANTPVATIERQSEILRRAFARDDVVERVKGMGFVSSFREPAALTAFVMAEIERWSRVIRAGDIKAR